MDQLVPASLLRGGLNTLQTGALRMPTLFAQMVSVLAIGEIAVRSIKYGLDCVGVSTGGKFAAKFSEWTSITYTQRVRVVETGAAQQRAENAAERALKKEVQVTMNCLRPFEKMSAQQLVTVAFVAGLFGNVGAAAIDFAFGPAPAIYNRVLSFLGNIRVESGAVHPLVRYVSSFIRKT